jgi:hypothetical protein
MSSVPRGLRDRVRLFEIGPVSVLKAWPHTHFIAQYPAIHSPVPTQAAQSPIATTFPVPAATHVAAQAAAVLESTQALKQLEKHKVNMPSRSLTAAQLHGLQRTRRNVLDFPFVDVEEAFTSRLREFTDNTFAWVSAETTNNEAERTARLNRKRYRAMGTSKNLLLERVRLTDASRSTKPRTSRHATE